MTLIVKPVRLNKSIYVRVPNDLADLIGLDKQDAVSLTFEDAEGEFRLIYAVRKPSLQRKVNPTLIHGES